MDAHRVVDPFDPRVSVSMDAISVDLVEGVDYTRDDATVTLHTTLPLHLRFDLE